MEMVFFRFDWTPDSHLSPGWHPVQVDLITTARGGQQTLVSGTGEVHVPYKTQYGFISDIDDTFLISHSATKLKRLLVLLTQNAHSRKPFEGVVRHYQALSLAGTTTDMPNPFFMCRAVNGICTITFRSFRGRMLCQRAY